MHYLDHSLIDTQNYRSISLLWFSCASESGWYDYVWLFEEKLTIQKFLPIIFWLIHHKQTILLLCVIYSKYSLRENKNLENRSKVIFLYICELYIVEFNCSCYGGMTCEKCKINKKKDIISYLLCVW
jgi:hypothetical protein